MAKTEKGHGNGVNATQIIYCQSNCLLIIIQKILSLKKILSLYVAFSVKYCLKWISFSIFFRKNSCF